MPKSIRGATIARLLVGTLSIGCLFISSTFRTEQGALAGSPADSKVKRHGKAEAGRSVFNGKGVCYYCHGVDGYRDKVPELEAGTAALIAQLNPQPSDLRNPKSLRLTTDKARAKVIREGHPGTGMFPDTTMTNQELADTLAYLALLRREGTRKPGDALVPQNKEQRP
jgi:mono/diheme cytochrome c family protein